MQDNLVAKLTCTTVKLPRSVPLEEKLSCIECQQIVSPVIFVGLFYFFMISVQFSLGTCIYIDSNKLQLPCTYDRLTSTSRSLRVNLIEQEHYMKDFLTARNT